MTQQQSLDTVMAYAKQMKFQNIHFSFDPNTGIQSIIAVHDTTLGPAIGGCRCHSYSSTAEALKDVLDLAYMMTLKAAICDLPHGGAKSVIIKPEADFDREACFSAFADNVHQLNGTYITACDVGTSTSEMNIIAQRTPYVIGADKLRKCESNPGPHTALGVFKSIQAAVKHKLNQPTLEGITVAIQGLGSVGYRLAQLLHNAKATLYVTDQKQEKISQCADEFNATPVSLDAIYSVDADVFAPCALGGTINEITIPQIKAPIIAGSANNQLKTPNCASLLQQHNKLYAPDFIANAGGLINAALCYDYQNPDMAEQKIHGLYDQLLELFKEADTTHSSTLAIAEKQALEKIKKQAKKNDEECV